MGIWDDIVAAEERVTQEEAELLAARKALAALQASVVKGGPDVSSFQGDVDWTKVAGAGYDLTFLKVADGDVVDPTFTKTRVQAVENAGLSWAPYHFGRVASSGNSFRSGRVEAAMAVYQAWKGGGWGMPGDLPLVYDIEAMGGRTADQVKVHIIEFIDAYKALMGHPPIIYTMPAFWSGLSPGANLKAAVSDCPLWIAHWGVASPTIPAGWFTWTFWQTTDKAVVPGIASPCDLNKANITKTQLDALRIK